MVGLENHDTAPDTLLLDLTGCAHLFGGEQPLSQHIERDCNARGLFVRLALAETIGAAWAVAHYSDGVAKAVVEL